MSTDILVNKFNDFLTCFCSCPWQRLIKPIFLILTHLTLEIAKH